MFDRHIVDIDNLLNFVSEDTSHIENILQFFDALYFDFLQSISPLLFFVIKMHFNTFFKVSLIFGFVRFLKQHTYS
jgi:hypothetical protein